MGKLAPSRASTPRPPDADKGFTLVEVLVALAILAIALAAVLRALGQSIDLTIGLRDRTLALWVAQERAVEHQLKRDWPTLGDSGEGKMEFGGREWRWREKVSRTPSPQIRRIDIDVGPAKSPDTLASLMLYVRQPELPQQQPQ